MNFFTFLLEILCNQANSFSVRMAALLVLLMCWGTVTATIVLWGNELANYIGFRQRAKTNKYPIPH